MAASAATAVAAVLASALTVLTVGGAVAQEIEESREETFRLETLAEGLAHPWGLAHLPDGGILITERPGRLRLYKDGQLQDEAISGMPEVVARGQGGLLDVALHPGFADNGLVYLSYAGAGAGGANTEVARARFDGAALHDLEVIFRAEPKVGGGNHFGSRLLFAGDGTLYVSLGDRYSHRREAQSLANHLGTVVRLNDDGSVPPDNPFVGRDGARPEIFSYGHRNVQGLALHPETGEVWAHEHGPQGGDEVNVLKPGANYGWPAITYGIDYSGAIISDKQKAPGMEQPVVFWVPSIAPSGMAFYDGDAFPAWRGDLFVGALAHLHLRRLELDGAEVIGQEELLAPLSARIRAVTTGPDGLLYVLTDSADGKLLRLSPAAP